MTLPRSTILRALPLCVCLIFAGAGAAGAQPAGKAGDGFEAVSMPANMAAQNGEGIPAAPLVATAYGFIWLAVVVYVGSIALRARRLEQQVADLEAQLAAHTGRPSAG